MYYISKKVKDNYQVKDTESSEVFVKSYNELMVMHGRGLRIQGVAVIANQFIVMPVGLQVELTHNSLAKMSILTGSTSGITGLDLKVDGDRVIAKAVDKSFFDYIEKNAINNRFILKIPDIVTDIDDFFMEDVSDTSALRFYIHVELPSSLKRIGENAFHTKNVWKIQLNSILDIMKGSRSVVEYTTDSGIAIDYYLDKKESNLNVRHLCKDAIYLKGRSEIHLPCTEVLERYSFNRREDCPAIIYLGSCIRSIGAVGSNGFSVDKDRETGELSAYGNSESRLMTNASIFFLPDNSDLTSIDLSKSGIISENYIYCTSHILVLSDWEYEKLKPIIYDSKVDKDGVLGVLTYRSDLEFKFIRNNIINLCINYKDYFSKYLTLKSLGGVEILRLVNR